MTLKTMNQIKAARALLEWSAADLAEASGLSAGTVRRYEAGYTLDRISEENRKAIVDALARAGIEFIAGGVRKA